MKFGRAALGRAFWSNLVGLGVPGLVALLIIPVSVRELGHEKFGLVSLLWSLLIASNAFDFGMGRALTRHLAGGSHDATERRTTAIAALVAAIGMGTGAAALVGGAIAYFVPEQLARFTDGKDSRLLLVSVLLCVPMQAATVVARGYYEGSLQFSKSNFQRVLINITTLLAPVVAHPFDHSLGLAALLMLVVRLVAVFVFLGRVGRLPHGINPRGIRAAIGKLWSFASLFTAENAVKAVFGQSDRYFLWLVGGSAAVTLLAVPLDLTGQLLLPLGAFTTAIFPTLCTEPDRRVSFGAAVKYARVVGLFFALVPVIALLAANYFLHMWLGSGYDDRMAGVFFVLSCGLPFYAVASVFTCYLHSVSSLRHTLGISIVSGVVSLGVMKFGWIRGGVEAFAGYWAVKYAIEACALSLVSARVSRQ